MTLRRRPRRLAAILPAAAAFVLLATPSSGVDGGNVTARRPAAPGPSGTAEPAPATAAPAPSAPAADDAPASSPPRQRALRRAGPYRSLAGDVRDALDVRGARPTLDELTGSEVIRARIRPLEDRITTLPPDADPLVHAVAHADLANAFASHQLDSAAAFEYLAAVDFEPTFAPAWNNLASLLRRSGELKLAERVIDLVLDLEPRNGLAWFNRALIAEQRDRMEEADGAYLKALELEPALWLPARNPLIIGNRRAQLTLLRNYMGHGGARGALVLDPNPPIISESTP